ncbi:hypothetical protein DPMN_016029 [Dreissena polymorpha]|uniref:ERp29 N-terminal domain-containing protein n=1 Tax=Dreissena polymorpha TaxID=45954 RepID=A0A9D4NDZ4_DREPO|nr:hypothetical protein DPMN_016029 [Dreissena polymorpha]
MICICLSDYGDKENVDLAERYSIPIKKEDHPTYLLFLQGQEKPIRYDGDEKDADDIKKFIMKESGTSFLLFFKETYLIQKLFSSRLIA